MARPLVRFASPAAVDAAPTSTNPDAALLATEETVRLPAVLLCMLLPVTWDGIPFAAVGLPRAGGFYAITALMLAGVFLFLVRQVPSMYRYSVFTFIAAATPILLLTVSVVSGIYFYRNPVSSWGPELVYYTPCLTLFLLIALNIRLSEMMWGVAIATSLMAGLVILDQFVLLPMFNQYQSVSGFSGSGRRILVLKNDLGVSGALTFCWAITARSIGRMIVATLMFCLVFYDLVQVAETRLVIGALLITILLTILFVAKLGRKLIAAYAGVFLMITIAPLLFSRYIERMPTLDSIGQDRGVEWRFLSVDVFRNLFDPTYGLGFGIMSIKRESGSALAYAMHEAPKLYLEAGIDYQFFLADISLYGPLFQFGYLGLLLVAGTTFLIAFTLIRYGFNRALPMREGAAALGIFVLFLLISPWPTNMFTNSWAMMSGNMLLACAARAAYVRKTFQRFT